MLLLPELWQLCLLRDGMQLQENKEQVQGKLPGFEAEERLQQAADPQGLFYTQASTREKFSFMPKSYVFYGF